MEKHIVAFSGGLASAVVAQMIAKKHDNPILLFHDTKTEPEDNYRFRKEVSTLLDLPITERSDGRDIWQLFKDESYLGNARNTMCSRILKREQSIKFCKENLPCIIYFGFTPDEYMRAQHTKMIYLREGIETGFSLIDARISKARCREIVKSWGIRPPAMYCHFNHANCMPCIKGKLKYWGLVYLYEREAWNRARQTEIDHGHTILTDGRTLEDALPDCLRLAGDNKNQEALFDMPCDCMV